MADGEKQFKWSDIFTSTMGQVLGVGVVSLLALIYPPVRAWLTADAIIEGPRWALLLYFALFAVGGFYLSELLRGITKKVPSGEGEGNGSSQQTGTPQATAPVLSDLQKKLLKVIWDAGREITDEEVSRVANVPETVVRATLNAMFPEWVIRNYDYWTPTSTELKEKAVSFAIEQGWPMPSPND